MLSRCLLRGLRQASSARSYSLASTTRQQNAVRAQRSARVIMAQPSHMQSIRTYSSGKAPIDEVIEELQDQYATARDEFEIAMEETEKMSVYAEDDRQAAREELDKLHEQYQAAIGGPDAEMGEEIRRRIGQRIRELDSAVKNMEELAQNQD